MKNQNYESVCERIITGSGIGVVGDCQAYLGPAIRWLAGVENGSYCQVRTGTAIHLVWLRQELGRLAASLAVGQLTANEMDGLLRMRGKLAEPLPRIPFHRRARIIRFCQALQVVCHIGSKRARNMLRGRG
ncbi:MAG: hypothetical protein HY978_02110 [Candidatus Liptonbacteria bacterium]|nr:hypothetical protein [Candidatus Liptonbacteria bacterium]